MKWPLAILLTLALTVVACRADTAFDRPVVSVLLVLGTAAWATVDSIQLELRKNKNVFSSHPLGTFVCLILLWIVFFPWYLAVRYQRTHGLLPFNNHAEIGKALHESAGREDVGGMGPVRADERA
jgi:hypothetical protein